MLAMLLTCCMVLQLFMGFEKPVFAASTNKATQIFSGIEIEIDSSLAYSYKDNIIVEVRQKDNLVEKQILEKPTTTKTIRFALGKGNYTVKVQTKQFAQYTQDILVEDGWISKIRISPDKTNQEIGWIRIGDVNNDFVIDSLDQEKILEAIHNDSADLSNDINGDKKVDLVDLQYFVNYLNETNKESVIEKLAVPKAVTVLNGTTIQSGNVEDLIQNKGSLSLAPSKVNEVISETNPVELEFNLSDNSSSLTTMGGMTIQAPIDNSDGNRSINAITSGEIEVVYVEQSEEKTQIFEMNVEDLQNINTRARKSSSITMDAEGSLVLDFGKQIAVKKITIKITGTTKKEDCLVNIAKVEFVNNMKDKIPQPELNIPTLNEAVVGNKEISVSWNEQQNVSGYELYILGMVKSGQTQSEIVPVTKLNHTFTTINNESIKNFETYTIKVRSTNGTWKSSWSKEIKAVPVPNKVPDAPDNVVVESGYRNLNISWKDMEDSSAYMVYYKKVGETNFIAGSEEKITSTRYTITGLQDNTEYQVYVVGWNDLGWGAKSLISIGKTIDPQNPKLPNYKLLNTSNGHGKKTAHIKEALKGGTGKIVDSPLDELENNSNSAWAIVDDEYSSYWIKEDWDDGVAYPGTSKGFYITFDDEYEMNYFAFSAVDYTQTIDRASVWYWNDENKENRQSVGAKILKKFDANNNIYYLVKLDSTVKLNKIHFCLGNAYGYQRPLKVGEVHFYQYDDLEDTIMQLYKDEMHTTLKADVTKATIEALEKQLEKVDKSSGEKHPLYQELKIELNTAKEILDAKLAPSYQVISKITAKKDTNLGFSGLNAWQPLGKVAYAGERIIVYVGHPLKRTGDSTDLQLIVTQHHSESNALSRAYNLKVGRNELTIPTIFAKDFEKGGQLYIAYTGNNDSDQYGVRVGGGTTIPILNLYGKDDILRKEAIKTYLSELEAYVSSIESKHETLHSGVKAVDYAYDEKNCILNATDILLEDMMYSVPATQVWNQIKEKEDKVLALDKALQAMEDTMTLFYQHKGLKVQNNLPSQHLNIRYMRMFSGAFMYAAGQHIGVEWNSTSIVSSATSMDSFGWGIAHEIGHNINQNAYAIAEITNNYFAQLLTKKTAGTRFNYKDVYKKVTSGTIGRSSNEATQLALYWQLHLAFDDNKDDRAIYDKYETQLQNLFFARVDTYAREPQKAPQSGLKLGNDVDQNLMRLACAAANQNMLPFFERWGMVADEETVSYANKYGEPTNKAFYYVNDDARDYRVDYKTQEEVTSVKNKDVVNATVSAKKNQVELQIQTTANKDTILGYEIRRSITTNGKEESQVVGFVELNKDSDTTIFTDTVFGLNHRVLSYEVAAVDKYLNYSNAAKAGSVKVQCDGELDKEDWTIQTNMSSTDDKVITPDVNNPDNGQNQSDKTVNSIERIIDGQLGEENTYKGTSDSDKEIVIDLHKTQALTALKYQGSILQDVTIQVSQDGTNWTTVKEKVELADGENSYQTIWFDAVEESERDSWIGTYDARYVKLTSTQVGEVSIKEIELCGPSGDNLEFEVADGIATVGILADDYQYGEKDTDKIPKGSLIFTGTYKGNPAYNMVILYDTNGNIIGAKEDGVEAEQVIFAKVPQNGNLGETSDGRWVYYLKSGQWSEESLKQIAGVRGELYRVDHALTLEGERVVSDTQIIKLPQNLPQITLKGDYS